MLYIDQTKTVHVHALLGDSGPRGEHKREDQESTACDEDVPRHCGLAFAGPPGRRNLDESDEGPLTIQVVRRRHVDQHERRGNVQCVPEKRPSIPHAIVFRSIVNIDQYCQPDAHVPGQMARTYQESRSNACSTSDVEIQGDAWP